MKARHLFWSLCPLIFILSQCASTVEERVEDCMETRKNNICTEALVEMIHPKTSQKATAQDGCEAVCFENEGFIRY